MLVDYNLDWGFKKHVKILIPSIMSMVFVSFYSVIDNLFVGKFVGSNAIASITIVSPLINVFWGIGIMLAAGSSSYVSMKLGEGDISTAKKYFTKMAIFIFKTGLFMTVVFVLFLHDIIKFLGVTDTLYENAYKYAIVLCISSLSLLFKLFFEYYVRVDGSTKLSLYMSFLGLVLNIIFDYIFVVIFSMGVLGAAIATSLSIFSSLLIGVWYFLSKKSTLKFNKPDKHKGFIKNSIFNGMSEMFSEFSGAFIIFLFNSIVMSISGEDGLAAFSIMMNLYYITIGIFVGSSFGSQPIISYNYGALKFGKMKKMIKYSAAVILILSVVCFLFNLLFASFIPTMFVSNENVILLASNGIRISSLIYLANGFNIFLSSLYTSVGNGKISAILSILRSFVFIILNASILPRFMGINGIWLSMPLSEIMCLLVSFYYLKKFNANYIKEDV